MRGRWVSYDSFNLTELIDELKTRIKEPLRVDDILHGMMIGRKDYFEIRQTLIEFLIEDDKKGE